MQITRAQAGTAAGENVGEYLISATGSELSNYDVTYNNTGKLTINKRTVTLTSADATQEYNGSYLTNHTVNVGGDGWATGEGATYNFTGQQLLPGNSPNAFTYTLNNNTLAANYNITKTEGTLTVTDRTESYVVTMTSNSNTTAITYDGLPHTIDEFVTHTFTTSDGNTYTVTGLTASVTQTFAGTYDNAISGTAVVTDAYGNDVTGQFTVNQTPGTLTIGKRPITFTIASEDATKSYDGTPLTVSYNQLTVNGLASTDQLIGGTITTNDFTVGLYPISEGNMFRMMADKLSTKSGFSIKHSNGELVKTLASYTPTFTITLSITSHPLTITATSETKPYDGTPLTGSFTSEGLASGDALSVTVEGSQTCLGEHVNTVTGYQVMRSGVDVTGQYSVTTADGILKVTPATGDFNCPAGITITLPEGASDVTVLQSQLGTPSHALITAGYAHATNNLASQNLIGEGTHTVIWTLRDNCDSAMTTCTQVVTVDFAPCVGTVELGGYNYPIKRIGSQCWFTENLKVATGDYKAYKEDASNVDKFGYLYTWYTAVGVPEGTTTAVPVFYTAADGSQYVQGICPAGWSVGSSADYNILNNYAGGTATLKDPSTQYWQSGYEGIAPGTGFNARGGGWYNSTLGRYEDIMTGYHFWKADAPGVETLTTSTTVISCLISYWCDQILEQTSSKYDRQSVRCIKKQ